MVFLNIGTHFKGLFLKLYLQVETLYICNVSDDGIWGNIFNVCPSTFPVFTIKQQNKEVIEIPVPSLTKIEREKEKEKKPEDWVWFRDDLLSIQWK